MKNFAILLFFVSYSLFAQKTYVPDDNFEQALIDLGYDIAPLDDSVRTANINRVKSLDVSWKYISSLIGIKDFTDLTSLSCSYNALTSLDLSSNTALTRFECTYNKLTSLDVRNGNNANFTYFLVNNPNLTCIYVDDIDASYLSNWGKDTRTGFAENEEGCFALSNIEISEKRNFTIYPNPVKEQFSIQTDENIETIQLYNVSGKLTKTFARQASYLVSDLQSGLYFISITGKGNSYTQKLLIE